MKLLSSLLVLAALGRSAHAQEGTELNGMTCQEAQRKDSVGFLYSASEFLYDLDPASLADAPADCLPADTNLYGAWYKLNVPGSANLILDTVFFTQNGGDYPHYVSVFQGDCDALTCVAFDEATVNPATGTMEASAPFALVTNTPYYLFFSVAKVPNANVPQMGIQLATPEADCKLFRSDQINFDSYSGNELGTCTPCEGDTTESLEVWTTTCNDACPHCYNTTDTETFCYTGSRQWTKTVSSDGSTQQVQTCYNFEDGNVVCDEEKKTGDTCPLEINGVACTSCSTNLDATGCAYPNDELGTFTADCSNLEDGSGVVDKCTNTGFEASPALTDLGILTDIILANRYGLPAFVPEYEGQCTPGNEAEGVPIQTQAPTLEPDPAVPLEIGDEFGPFNVSLRENKVFMIDVTGLAGILTCEVDGESGDVDLFMGIDFIPLGDQVNCASELYTSEEECSVVVEEDNFVYALVYGYRPATEVTIECDMTTTGDAREFPIGVGKTSSYFDLDTNQYRLYRLALPDDTSRVACDTKADDGDLDLFFRMGAIPVPYWRQDCKSDGADQYEYCELTENIAGQDLYVLLKGHTNVTEGLLSCEVSLAWDGNAVNSGDADELQLGDSARKFDLLVNENRLFKTTVPEGTTKVWFDLSSDKGDVDLYLRVGEVPVLPGEGLEGGVYDCASLTPTGEEYCFYEWTDGAPQKVDVYSLVTGFGATKAVEISTDADTPLTVDDAEQIFLGDTERTDLEEKEEKLYYFDVDEFTESVTCVTETQGDGDVDIYMRKGKDNIPERDGEYDCAGAGAGGEESCTVTWDGDGSGKEERVHLLLYGYNRVSRVDFLCEGISNLVVATERNGDNPDLP